MLSVLSVKLSRIALARVIVAVSCLLLLSACGQKGPLYMPEDAPDNQEFIIDQAPAEESSQ